MTKTFREFVDKKNREALKHLKIIKKLLESTGFVVDDYLKSKDPYIFLNSNDEQLSFGGVRIYNLGDTIAYRVQKEKDTHPYGDAYLLDIESIFNDYISDTGDEEATGKKIIKLVAEEFKNFFKDNKDAEQELKSTDIEDAKNNGSVAIRSNALDYSLMIGK